MDRTDTPINRRTFIKAIGATLAAEIPIQAAFAQSTGSTAGCAPYGSRAYGAGVYSGGSCVPTRVEQSNEQARKPATFWVHTAIITISAASLSALQRRR